MAKLGFYFDQTACIGCRTCQIACKDRNNLEIGTIFRRVRNFETGAYPKVGSYNFSSTCNHCENAPCVSGCPTGAMHKGADGTVQHDKALCIGCQYCTWNCPYGIPQYIEGLNKVGKCDACADKREKGEDPVCVSACIMRCLEFGDIDELSAKYGETVRELPILPPAAKTEPCTLIKAKSAALSRDFVEKEV